MYNNSYRFCGNMPVYNPFYYPCPHLANINMHCNEYISTQQIPLKDYGPEPFTVNIHEAAVQNNTFRTALWTGEHLQVTLMSIDVGGEIGLEMHSDVDQFLRLEQGEGLVLMGDTSENLTFRQRVYDDYAIVIPAGKWHNLINIGCTPIKLYSIYAPPEHPHGTVHLTKAESDAAHAHEHQHDDDNMRKY